MFRRLCCFRLITVLESCHSDALFQDINLQPYYKIGCVKSILWPALISNVVNVSLPGGSLGYWTACNNFKRYYTLSYYGSEISINQAALNKLQLFWILRGSRFIGLLWHIFIRDKKLNHTRWCPGSCFLASSSTLMFWLCRINGSMSSWLLRKVFLTTDQMSSWLRQCGQLVDKIENKIILYIGALVNSHVSVYRTNVLRIATF